MNPKFQLSLLNHLFEQQNTQTFIEVSANPTYEQPILAQMPTSQDLGWLIPVGIISGSLITVLITIYVLFSKFYRVCNTNEAFVISGPTRDKQVVTRSTLFFPGFETITVVSLNQVTVTVVRGNTIEKPLRTKDYLKAVFNGSLQVRVNPDQDSVRNAAMLLGAGKKENKKLLSPKTKLKSGLMIFSRAIYGMPLLKRV